MTAFMTDALAAAIEYARRGWRPIPLDHPSLRRCTGPLTDDHDPKTCDKRGKHPAGKWGTIAAHDPSEKWLEHLFGREQRNVGIAVKLSGLIVLDEDDLDALTRLAAELGKVLPTTYRVRTRAGWHWYFLAPDGIEIGNRTKGTPLAEYRIDVRGGKGDGGYVVAAGSLHASGHVYAAEDDTATVAPLPRWLVDMLTADPQVADGVAGGPTPSADPDAVRVDTAERFLEQYARRVAECRHQGAVWREELFTAATDGWRLVDLDELTVEQLEDDLNERCRAVWGADLDARDRRIWATEARERARRSPWELADYADYKIPKAADETYGTRATSSTDGERSSADPSPRLIVDLAPYLLGDVETEPTVRGVRRSDDVPLLYAGRDHTVIGETEAGKSWLALACAVAELKAGRRVLYLHFEESDPRTTVLRFRQMGEQHLLATGAFAFAGIDVPINAAVHLAELIDHRADLVILDGVNAAMSLHGWDTNSADGVGVYRARIVAPFLGTGATVLALDHVVKNPEQRGNGYAMGSAMKLNMVSGASFLMENREPLRPGAVGETSVYVVKDRPGSLRAESTVKTSGRRALFGTMRVDSTTALTEVRLTRPGVEAVTSELDDELAPIPPRALKVLVAVARLNREDGREKPPSTREVRRSGPGVTVSDVPSLLDTLEAHGLVARETDAGTTRWLLVPAGEKALLPPGTTHVDDL